MQELFIINKIIYQVGAATIYTYIIYLNIIVYAQFVRTQICN